MIRFQKAWRATILNLGSTAGVLMASLAAYMLGTVILARHLPRSELGQITLWVNALNLLGAASLFGFPNAFLRHFSAKELGKADYLSAMLRLTPLALVISAVGAWIFYQLYDLSVLEVSLLMIGAAALGLCSLPVTLLTIFKRVTLGQVIYTVWRHSFLIASVFVVLAGLGRAWTLVAGAVSAVALLQVFLGIRALKTQPSGQGRIRLVRILPDAALMSGLFVASVLIMRLDNFFVAKLIDFDSLGLYGALGFFMLTGYGIVSLALGQILNAKLANRESVPFRTVAFLAAVGGVGVGSLLAVMEPLVLPAVYGEMYAGDFKRIAFLMVISGTLQVLYAIPSSRLGVLGPKQGLVYTLFIGLASVMLGTSLLFWLVPKWGLEGAALATASVWAFRLLMTTVLSIKMPLKPIGELAGDRVSLKS